MKKWIIFICFLAVLLLCGFFTHGLDGSMLVASEGSKPGNSYYVSNYGNDGNTGTSFLFPWKTLQKVNQYKLEPGDTVYFQKGGVWRGQLIPQSGDETRYIRYTSYGLGGNPQILGSIEKNTENEWTQGGERIWVTGPFEADIGNIILDNGRLCGVKVWNETDLKEQNDFWFDQKSGMLKMYSIENPARMYKDVECAVRKDIISQRNKGHIIYEGLSLKCGGAHGIYGTNASNTIIRNCVISFIGGGDQYQDGRQVRFGNGVEFWNSAHDIRVEKCRIFEIYDAAVTNQGSGDNNSQFNITYSGNQIWNCEYSYEYWNGPQSSVTQNITFESNICRNAGGGWGHNQRPDPSGRHICFYTNTAQTENIMIRNNVFYIAEEACVFVPPNSQWLDSLFFGGNFYTQSRQKTLVSWQRELFSAESFEEYKAYTGQDRDSTVRYPEEE